MPYPKQTTTTADRSRLLCSSKLTRLFYKQCGMFQIYAMNFFDRHTSRAGYLKALPDGVQKPDVVPRLVRPLVGIPEHAAVESKPRRIHMEPSRPAAPLARVPSNHSAIVTDRALQLRLALPHAQHCNRPGAKTPEHCSIAHRLTYSTVFRISKKEL